MQRNTIASEWGGNGEDKKHVPIVGSGRAASTMTTMNTTTTTKNEMSKAKKRK